ncbi:MAG: methylated-DNA--[protein]-cysteine S-methyltransferase [Muribaculaceae bacterium]|nr:methylated-DNA--[protein]-cysteine S-methyltransferase [Muribaculaceae bacterium]
MTVETPIGALELTCKDRKITRCKWVAASAASEETPPPDGFEIEIISQLKEYFEGCRSAFSLPIEIDGTEFQKKVWRELLNVKYGETVTYGEIARRIGNPGALRAVGTACKMNPIAILVPCHRVVAAGGKPGGYNGGMEKKFYLLELEMSFGKFKT